MTQIKQQNDQQVTRKQALAKALRENLLRRKAQQRERARANVNQQNKTVKNP